MSGLGILAGALGGAADVAGEQARRGMKEEADQRAADRALSNQERLMASKMMMEQRAKEWDQGQAKLRAERIETKAQGLLAARPGGEPVIGYEGDSGDVGILRGAIPAEATDADKWRARSEAAFSEGDFQGAAASRGVLDVERRFAADEKRAANDADRIKAQDRKTDALEESNRRREERLDGIAAASVARDGARETAADARERRAATATALKSAQEDIKSLEGELTRAFKPEEKKAISDQITKIRKEVEGYRKELSGVGIGAASAPTGSPTKPFNPAEFTTNKPPAATPAATATRAQMPTAPTATAAPRSTGQQVFGPFTPEKLVREEVAAGNPKAIEYLKKLEKAQAEEEERRNTDPFYGRGY